MTTGVFEVLMLLCFAVSWPFSIVKSYKAGTAYGKSILFECLVQAGYIFGMMNKVVNGDVNYVFAFYVLDFSLVLTDMVIWRRNRRLDAMRAAGTLLDRTIRLSTWGEDSHPWMCLAAPSRTER